MGSGSGAEPQESRVAALGSNGGIAAAPNDKVSVARQNARDSRWGMARTAAGITQNRGQLGCGYNSTGGNPQVFASSGRASYAGVQTCGKLWTCPTCATRITEQRKSELDGAIKGWAGCTLNVTRTIRHTKWDDLGSLVNKLRDAHRWFSSHRVCKRWRERLGATNKQLGGTVRALEVTHAHPGKWDHNGWHPHEHELWLCSRTDIGEDEVEQAGRELSELWVEACQRIGLPAPSVERGYVMELGKAADYVAKWGIAEELTKSHLKQGKEGSVSTWGLLRVAHEGGEHAARASSLFLKFAEAFHGRHQLQWSRGLRDHCGLSKEELTDEELAARTVESEANFVCEIEMSDWRVVRRRRMQSNLLTAAEEGGAVGVEKFLRELRQRSGPPRGVRHEKMQLV